MNDRLRRYDSAGACGKWNATLIEDFRSDREFIRTVDELFGRVVAEYTHSECITSDGLSLETGFIDLGLSLDLYFCLHFLDAPNGHGIAPAKYSVAVDTTHKNHLIATLCCGLREPDGDFWYPTTSAKYSVVMPEGYAWAFTRRRIYGPPNFSSWMKQLEKNGGEQ